MKYKSLTSVVFESSAHYMKHVMIRLRGDQAVSIKPKKDLLDSDQSQVTSAAAHSLDEKTCVTCCSR